MYKISTWVVTSVMQSTARRGAAAHNASRAARAARGGLRGALGGRARRARAALQRTAGKNAVQLRALRLAAHAVACSRLRTQRPTRAYILKKIFAIGFKSSFCYDC